MSKKITLVGLVLALACSSTIFADTESQLLQLNETNAKILEALESMNNRMEENKRNREERKEKHKARKEEMRSKRGGKGRGKWHSRDLSGRDDSAKSAPAATTTTETEE